MNKVETLYAASYLVNKFDTKGIDEKEVKEKFVDIVNNDKKFVGEIMALTSSPLIKSQSDLIKDIDDSALNISVIVNSIIEENDKYATSLN